MLGPKRERGSLRTQFTKAATSLRNGLKDERPTKVTVKTLLKQLEERAEMLQNVDQRILEMMQNENTTDEEFNQEFDSTLEYRDTLSQCRMQVDDVLEHLDKKASECESRSEHGVYHGNKRKYKLPVIQMKSFGGEIREWLGFWHQFKKIHEDEDVAAEDKFQYLVQATVPGSKARDLVDSFPQTSDNYPKVIEHLRSRFGNEEMLVEVYVRELLKLVLSNALDSKRKVVLSSLYDKLEAQLRALESLSVTSDKYSSILYPLVESSLPEDVLRAWERNKVGFMNTLMEIENPAVNKPSHLDMLMKFLRGEVDGEERISLARSGFGMLSAEGKFYKKSENEEKVPTAAGLFNQTENTNDEKKIQVCLFCDKNHDAQNCFVGNKLSLEEKKKIVTSKRGCFTCLKVGHYSKVCKRKIKCQVCSRKHFVIMCPDLPNHRMEIKKMVEMKDTVLSNQTCSNEVVLQTLIARIQVNGKERLIRILIDTGSTRTYLSDVIIRDMKIDPVGQVKLVHSLFGGMELKEMVHGQYEVNIKSVDHRNYYNFIVLNQSKICGYIPRIRNGPWIDELKKHNVHLTDVGENGTEIDMLIGSDYAGKVYTGRKITLSNELYAFETCFGWTLMGEIDGHHKMDHVMLSHSLFVQEANASDLWSLDAIGIKDSAETKSKKQYEDESMQHFLKTVKRDTEERYEVSLPWIEDHPPLKDNYKLAEQRLLSMSRKLSTKNRSDYQKVFDEWMTEGIIEEVPESDLKNFGHYLPHKPVIKESSETTKVRPVFDASAKEKHSPSLNDCLHKGLNMLELIPTILTKFRVKAIGVVSDIRKAFLQLSVKPEERDFLRFLWWKDEKLCVYRHRRVVFGVSSSPFLLGAVLNHLLDNAPKELKNTAIQLKESFYVDNCVTSLDTIEEAMNFKNESVAILSPANIDLRGWEGNLSEFSSSQKRVPVLGLTWDLSDDTLSCDFTKLSDYLKSPITKRAILSATHRIFDPIGFSTPVMIQPKLILQEIWEMKISWDENVPENVAQKFISWINQFDKVKEMKIPRYFGGSDIPREKWSLHIFGDASKDAFATCVFLRLEGDNGVQVHLIQAKTRIAPTKCEKTKNGKTVSKRIVTIPRLELLSCLIAARLADSVKKDLKFEDIPCFYYTDSLNALYWIKNEDEWGTFIWRRVEEIRKLSNVNDWRHIPGVKNPADLPSRGCSITQLLESKWWKGPEWLKLTQNQWPRSNSIHDEIIVFSKRKKTVLKSLQVYEDDEEII